jgi:hypothetical protein
VSGQRLLDYWQPPAPDDPVACLATTFTFDADFFAQNCLARFLGLSAVTDEGDAIASVAALLEEEERLSEAQVSVLVDRNTPAEKRNLRWDVLPVTVPGGLLHAKVAVLLWRRTARVILGSANLTAAGYRRQVEIAIAIDLDDTCPLPRPVLGDLVAELRLLVELASATPARERALYTVELLAARVDSLKLPTVARGDLLYAIAPARPGERPLIRVKDVWRGAQPLHATVLSPFWDDDPAAALDAIRGELTGRPATDRTTTAVVGSDPFTGAVQAPAALAQDGTIELAWFDAPDRGERRTLHAKLVVFYSDEWLAAMLGSSNATAKGLGLAPRGHRELNLWLGCRNESKAAEHLWSLAGLGEAVDVKLADWEPPPDEDEATTPTLPEGFVTCTVVVGPPAQVILDVRRGDLPPRWRVETPEGQELLSSRTWQSTPDASQTIDLHGTALPSFLVVHWQSDGAEYQATWIANIDDRGALPPPAELAALEVDILLAALASTRPLPVALEQELRKRSRLSQDGKRLDLDPLRRYDDSGLLLQRTRHLSIALWRLEERLSRPVASMDALRWRLNGVVGPVAIADGVARTVDDNAMLPGEAHFLLAELALAVQSINWRAVAPALRARDVRREICGVIDALDDRRKSLPVITGSLGDYVTHAFAVARK